MHDADPEKLAKEEAVQAALRRLPLLPGVEIDGRLARATGDLVRLARPDAPRRRPNAHIRGSARTRQAELARLAELEAYADHLDKLHGAAIDALACHGVEPIRLAEALRKAARVCHVAELPELSESDRGRRPNLKTIGITKVAARHVEALTGQAPGFTKAGGKPHGPWLDLLAVLFASAGLQASPVAQTVRLRSQKNGL